MTISAYPNGFMNGVTMRGVPVTQTHPGQVFWVNNSSVLPEGGVGGNNGNPGTYTKPFSTLDYAVGKCTASRGDIIALMPGHAETIATATALALDVAGIAIVGLGSGTLRPTFTMSAATSTIAVSGADTSIKNCIFTSSVADCADLFTPSAVNFHLEDCKFTQDAAGENIIELVDTGTTDNECDGLSFLRCEWIEADTATTSMVNVDADLDRLSVVDCYIDLGVNGVLSAIAEVAAGKDLTNVNWRGNYVSRLVAASAVQLATFVDTTTTNTGIATGNLCRSLDIAGELLIAGTNISQYNNYSTSVIDKSGYLLPAADA
jgi:hypothetical protein